MKLEDKLIELGIEIVEEKKYVNLPVDVYVEESVIIKKWPIVLLGIFLIILVSSIVLGVLNREKIKDYFSNVELYLRSDKKQIEVFDNFDINSELIKGEKVSLEISEYSTDRLGEQEIIVKGKTNAKEKVVRFLLIVKDTKAPEVKLKEYEKEIQEDETLDLNSLIESTNDNFDKDLEAKPQSTIDKSRDNQEIVYLAKDNSGNEGKAVLKLRIKRKPKEEPTVATNNNNNNNTTSNRNTTPRRETNRSNPTPPPAPAPAKPRTQGGTKNFMFSQGYNLNTGFDACVAEGSKYNSYSCVEIRGANNLITGYKLTYR